MGRSTATTRVRSAARRGVTLLELLLASSLILLTLGTLFGFYTIALQATARVDEHTRRSQQARVVLQQLGRELRQATSGAIDRGNPLVGTMHSLTIETAAMPDPAVMYDYGLGETEPEPSLDRRRLEYYMAVDDEQMGEDGSPIVGLVRRETRLLARRPDDVGEEIAAAETRVMSRDVRYIRFRYFDGVDWTDFWIGGRGNRSLPQAVKVEIGFDADAGTLGDTDPGVERQLDLLGNPAEEAMPAGRYSLIVRLPGASPWGESRMVSGMQGLSNGGQ